jgi:pSer/pThr/pTyr-binding forkhead associated (FHA) protein
MIGLDPIPHNPRLSPEQTFLQLKNGPKAQQRFSLHRISQIIGRSQSPSEPVDIDLGPCEFEGTPMISRRHALVEWQNGNLHICDLNSRNGTWVDGKPLKTQGQGKPSPFVPLALGSQLKFGNLELEVIINE